MTLLKNTLRKKYFTAPNAILTDNNLSHGAIVVYLYLCSKPETWDVNNSDIKKSLNIKRSETLSKYWKELIEFGWLQREKKKDEKGSFMGGFDYRIMEAIHITEKADYGESPYYGKSGNTEKPELRKNRTLSNTDLKSNTDIYSNTDKEKIYKKEKEEFSLQNQKKENLKPANKNFSTPTVDEIKEYCTERQNSVDSEMFFNYYESVGWVVGGGNKKMKCWKASVRTWEKREFNQQTIKQNNDRSSKTQNSTHLGVPIRRKAIYDPRNVQWEDDRMDYANGAFHELKTVS